MALTKRVYTDGETIITAQNLNDIQDEIISQGNTLVPKTRTINSKALSSNITLTSGDIGYNSSTTYSSGSVGKAVSDLNGAINSRTREIKTVGVGKDFTTWKAATEYTWTHQNVDFYVYGVFDVLTEYGSTYLNNVPSSADYNHSIGPEIYNNARFFFMEGAKIVANYTGSSGNVATMFSPVNIGGSCEFYNMNIEVTNCRYCVHDDPYTIIRNVPSNAVVKYIDCIMNHKGSTIGSYTDTTLCIGGGCFPDSLTVVKGGDYKTTVDRAISYHKPSDSSYVSHNTIIYDSVHANAKLVTSSYLAEIQSTIDLFAYNCSCTSIVAGTGTTLTEYNNNCKGCFEEIFNVSSSQQFRSGSITVPNFSKYRKFIFYYDLGHRLEMFWSGTAVTGGSIIGSYNSESMLTTAARYTFTSSTSELSITNLARGFTDGTTSNYGGNQNGLIAIYGILRI